MKKGIFILLVIFLIAGCCPKTYILLPDPYKEAIDRQIQEKSLENQRYILKNQQ